MQLFISDLIINNEKFIISGKDFKLLIKFLGSEQHLSQNITSVVFSPPSSRCFRNGYFTHTMAIVLHVKTDRLWETPASYIRKHLGFTNNEWSKQNGTVVKLSRIHQKSSVAS